MSKVILLVVALLLSLSMIVYSETVIVTCSSADVNKCPDGFEYTFTSNGNTVTKCINECTFQSVNLEIFPCQKDYLGSDCAAKTCFYSIDRERCLDVGQVCNTEKQIKSVCGQCGTNQCSSEKCYTPGGTEYCYPNQVCQYDQMYFGYKKCQNDTDFLGYFCKCCGRLYGQGNLGQCISDTNLDDQAVRVFAQNFKNTYVYDPKQFEDGNTDEQADDTKDQYNLTDFHYNDDNIFGMESGIKNALLVIMLVAVGLL